ncbi:MAG: N-acetylmuramoyl-L-alanine amidase [Candidatus Thorarchaeota archaeon]
MTKALCGNFIVGYKGKYMQTCALVIGHRKESPGACNANYKDSEYKFNDVLAGMIENRMEKGSIIKVYRTGSYIKLPIQINTLLPSFILSLHCNSFNRKASGTEVLYYEHSGRGRIIAGFLQERLVRCLKLYDRGIKAKSEDDRGGYLLKYTSAPCIIAEPFFIDNDEDLLTAKALMGKLAKAYADAIYEIFSFLRR